MNKADGVPSSRPERAYTTWVPAPVSSAPPVERAEQRLDQHVFRGGPITQDQVGHRLDPAPVQVQQLPEDVRIARPERLDGHATLPWGCRSARRSIDAWGRQNG
jgi:hypothetical protein